MPPFLFCRPLVLERHAGPEARQLSFTAADDGVLNAVVFWHELVLEEGKVDSGPEDAALLLSSSPFNPNRGPSMQQVSDENPCMIHPHACSTCASPPA